MLRASCCMDYHTDKGIYLRLESLNFFGGSALLDSQSLRNHGVN